LADTADETARDALVDKLRAEAAVSGARSALVEPTLPGVRNGGDVLVHLRFEHRDGWEAVARRIDGQLAHADVQRVNGATYHGNPVTGVGGSGSIYRTLLLRVAPGTSAALVEQFENDLRLLPRYVRSIHTWQLSRVEEAVGTSPWTHVFEQEFTDFEGLMGPYLMHPIHWAHVDRWFDPECPEVIIRDRVCHSFCRNTTPVLA
jgi:hypothetical protein